MLASTPTDVLCLSIRASIKGNHGDLRAAQEDLASTNDAVLDDRMYVPRTGDADGDFDFIARGWAYLSVRLISLSLAPPALMFH